MAGADTYMDSTATIYTGDTEVTPYIDGVGYFKRIHDQILATTAGDHIFIVNWQIDPWMDLEGLPTQPVDPPPSVPPPNCLLSLLANQALAGVDVKLVLNGAYFTKRKAGTPFTRCLRAAEAFRAAQPLKDSVLFDWTGANFGSQHQKATLITVAGDMFAYIGGMDYWPIRLDQAPYDRQSWPDPHPDGAVWGWHDAGIEVHGKAVEAVWENFRLRWAEAATQPKYSYQKGLGPENPLNPAGSPTDVPTSPTAPEVPGASQTLSTQILRSRWKVKESNFVHRDKQWDSAPPGQITEVFNTLAKAIDVATTYVYFEDQFLDDMPTATLGASDGMSIFWPHLQGAAARDVKVILLGSGKGDPDDAGGPTMRNQQWPDGVRPPMPADLQSTWVNRLKDMVTELDKLKPTGKGHNVVVWRFDNITVHAKLALIDDRFCAIGSANMQSRSMAGVDSELTCAFYDDGDQVRDFRVQLWANHFRIPKPFDPSVLSALQDVDPESTAGAFSLWRPEWGTFPVFSPVQYSTGTQLMFVGPPY